MLSFAPAQRAPLHPMLCLPLVLPLRQEGESQGQSWKKRKLHIDWDRGVSEYHPKLSGGVRARTSLPQVLCILEGAGREELTLYVS